MGNRWLQCGEVLYCSVVCGKGLWTPPVVHKRKGLWNDMSWTNVDQTLGAIKMGLANYSGHSMLVSSAYIVDFIETIPDTIVH